MLIAHIADSHVGPMGSKLDPATGLNARMMDRARCLQFCIEDSIRREAELILFVGDFWAGSGELGLGSRPTPTQVRLVKDALKPAMEADVEVVAILGNHDAARASNEWHALDLLSEVRLLTIIDRPRLLDVWRNGQNKLRVSQATDAPSPDTELQVACLPYPQVNLLLRDEETRNLSPGDRNLLIRQKMMDCARGLAAERRQGVPRVLLGHFSVDVAAAGAQNRLMMLGAEFTLNVHELAALGFDAVLLGHIHKPQTLRFESEDVCSWIGYCGSPEAVTFGEEGEAKGYFLHDFGAHSHGFQESPYRKLVTLSAEDLVLNAFDEPPLLDAAMEECVPGAIIRLELPPDSEITIGQARRAIEEAGAFEVTVTQARAESERRVRESGITHAQPVDEQLREWLKLKPDLHPLTEQIIAEAMRIEQVLSRG